MAQRTTSRPRPQATSGVWLIGGVLATLVVVIGVVTFAASGTSDAGGVLVVAPLLFVVSLPFLSRGATREGDRRLYRLLMLALLVKFLGALIRYYVAFDVYGGVADAAGYHDAGPGSFTASSGIRASAASLSSRGWVSGASTSSTGPFGPRCPKADPSSMPLWCSSFPP
jgi:hypothetical protein